MRRRLITYPLLTITLVAALAIMAGCGATAATTPGLETATITGATAGATVSGTSLATRAATIVATTAGTRAATVETTGTAAGAATAETTGTAMRTGTVMATGTTMVTGTAMATGTRMTTGTAMATGTGAAAGGPLPTADAAMAETGATEASTIGCAGCHSIDGTTLVGPTWQGLYGSQVTLDDGTTVMADETYIRESILQPDAQIVQGFQPGVMPKVGGQLSTEQVDSLVEYIKSLGVDRSSQ
ncbi:MAG: c-type cytochrome [Anaerolineae bacterium]